MSLFLADGAPGMSCVTTPRLAAVVVRSRTRFRVLPGARERVLRPPTAVGRVVCGGASRCTRPAKMRWGSDAVRLTSCRRSPRDGN